jgi:copper chaperone NosL
MLAGVLKEYFATKKEKKHTKHHKHGHAAALAGILLGVMLTSCGASGPQPIDLNNDNCDFCKMSISDKRFACEMVTAKGRVYKFDDVTCMVHYKKENKDKSEKATFFVSDFLSPFALVSTDKLTLLKGETIEGPMGGTIAAFSRADSASVYKNKLSAEIVSWQSVSE